MFGRATITLGIGPHFSIVCNILKNQRILAQFSLLDLAMNGRSEGMNFTRLT